MPEEIKLCKDCKHCRSEDVPDGKFFRRDYSCQLQDTFHLNHVTGEVRRYTFDCYTCRVNAVCGPKAKYFEPRLTLWQKVKKLFGRG